MNISDAITWSRFAFLQTVWILGCSATEDPAVQQSASFDSERWRSNHPFEKYEDFPGKYEEEARHNMLKELIAKHLPGRNRSQVLGMLGEADFMVGDAQCYMTGGFPEEAYSISPDGECLCISFDTQGLVSEPLVGWCP